MRAMLLVLLVTAVGRAALAQTPPDPVAICEGVADGVPCPENGDGCWANDGLDRCLSGSCTSPPPCERTTFAAKRKGRVRMHWEKDPTKVTLGEFCIGRVSVATALVQQLTSVVVPPDDGDQVILTRRQGSERTVPVATGRVQMDLRLNRLGRLLLARARGELPATARMTLVAPEAGTSVSANRPIMLRELLKKLR